MTNILKDIADELKPLGKTAAEQIAPKKPAHNPIEHVEKDPTQKKVEQAGGSEQDNKDFLEALYGSSKPAAPEAPKNVLSPQEQKAQEAFQKSLEGLTPEQQQEKINQRQQLQQSHSENYYQPLIQKIQQEGMKPEDQERAAERVERMEMEDLQEKQKKEEKKKPIAVDMAERSIEANRGTSG